MEKGTHHKFSSAKMRNLLKGCITKGTPLLLGLYSENVV